MALTSALSGTYANFRFSVEGLTPKNARLESSRTRRALAERYEAGTARPTALCNDTDPWCIYAPRAACQEDLGRKIGATLRAAFGRARLPGSTSLQTAIGKPGIQHHDLYACVRHLRRQRPVCALSDVRVFRRFRYRSGLHRVHHYPRQVVPSVARSWRG